MTEHRADTLPPAPSAAPLPPPLGWSARFAGFFLTSRLTPLLALVSVFLGLFAFLVTPREEEPQITRTIIDVLIPFPGASVRDVEQMVVNPAEQLLSQSPGVEHVVSVADSGAAMVSVHFESGVEQTEALVSIYNTINSHSDWVPAGLGILQPVIKPKDNDDVPVYSLVLYGRDDSVDLTALERIAHSVELELKRVPGTREALTVGGSARAITVTLDPVRLRAHNLTPDELESVILSANRGLVAGVLLQANRALQVDAGGFFRGVDDLANLVVRVNNNQPVLLSQVATLHEGLVRPAHYVWHGEGAASASAAPVSVLPGGAGLREYPAVTVTVTKQTGENVTDVVRELQTRTEELRNTLIPANVEARVVRNYGDVANDKIQLLMSKILLVTLSVAALIFLALGRRESAIVFLVILFTLSITFFVLWALGFSLNRATLFAAIISIGLLVDDAVVVIENIHRHHLLEPDKPILALVPRAIDEIGAPTILATFAVIAALMPIAFVSGVQGEYFLPVPVITSAGMLVSLLVALAITPWLCSRWMRQQPGAAHKPSLTARLGPFFIRGFNPLLDDRHGRRNRRLLALAVVIAMVLAVLAPLLQWVAFSMQPPDSKSEVTVAIDMPSGSPLEQTAALARELAQQIAAQPEVLNYQVYVGTPAPLGITGLIRKYYFRDRPEQAEIQINLIDKQQRQVKSYEFVERIRTPLAAIAARQGAELKVFDPPSGVPLLAQIVAEVYGPTAAGRAAVAEQLRAQFAGLEGVIDIDDSSITPARRLQIRIDQSKAMRAGISVSEISRALTTALQGRAVTYLHDGSKYAAPILLQLPAEQQGDLQALLGVALRGSRQQLVPLSELVVMSEIDNEQPIYHKDLLPVHMVMGNIDSRIPSPLWGMLEVSARLDQIVVPGGGPLQEYFNGPPSDPYRHYAITWDGEWQVTAETLSDLGVAYLVGIALIYLLIVSQFGSYTVPLIIMLPIPFTLIGQMAGHALLGTHFTAASMIGLTVLAGLIVRNSILLVDFIRTHTAAGMPLKEAVVQAATIRAQPILLTSLTAMVAALFLLDDPVFNGLAVALIFGNLASTGLTLIVIPTLYYALYQGQSAVQAEV